MRREFLKRLILGFLVVVFLITTASLVLRMILRPSVLREEIVGRLYEITGRHTGLTQATVSLTRGLVVKGFYLLDQAPSDLESVTFDRAVIGFHRWDLIRRRVRVRSIELQRPHLELIIRLDGSTNFGDVLRHMRHRERVRSELSFDDPGEDRRRDEDEPLSFDRIQVRGGSVTINRHAPEVHGDQYLDLTELSVDIENFSTAAPFEISVAGSVGVERQTTFTFHGMVDPVLGSVAGDLTMPLLQDSLINSLFGFTQVVDWRLTHGALTDLNLRVETGEGLSPIALEGAFETDGVETRVGVLRLKLGGSSELEAAIDLREKTIQLENLEIQIQRPGAEGVFRISGHVDFEAGEADLQLDLEGVGAENLRGLLPSPVRVTDPAAWLDGEVRLTMAEGFTRGRVEGRLEAKSLEVTAPALLRSDVTLDGLVVSGAMTYDVASGEFEVVESTWIMPDLITEANPLTISGGSATGLSVDLPELRWEALESRLEQHEEVQDPSSIPLKLLTGLRGGRGGLPVNLTLPAIRMADWEWTNIGGGIHLQEKGVVIDGVRGEVEGGEFVLSGRVEGNRRVGKISARGMPVERLRALWGIDPPGDVGGRFSGEFGGVFGRGRGLSEAAVSCTVKEARFGRQWLLEEIAEFLEIEAVRRWEGADATLVLALDEEGLRLTEVLLSQPGVRLQVGGRLYPDERMELAARIWLPPETAERRAHDTLFTRAPRDDSGWLVVTLSLVGSLSQPTVRPCSPETADAIMDLGRQQDVAMIFSALEMTPPEGLLLPDPEVRPIEPNIPIEPLPEVAPPSWDVPIGESQRPPRVPPRERPTAEPQMPARPEEGPQMPPPQERPGEIEE